MKLLIIILITLIGKDQTVILRNFVTTPTQQLVNDNINGAQSNGGIYNLSNDGFVIVWVDTSTQKHYMQIYNEMGDKLGTNIYIITGCSSFKSFIVDLGNNKFAFACFQSSFARLIVYDYNGSALLGPTKVSSSSTWLENFYIAKLDDGSLVLAWSSTLTEIHYSIVTQSGEFIVEGTIIQSQGYNIHGLALESFQNNRFILCWREIRSSDYMFCQVINSIGVTSIPQFQFDNFPSGVGAGYNGLCIKRASNNDILMIYHGYSAGKTYLFVSVCNSNGVNIYGPTQLSSYDTTGKFRPKIGVLSNGHFIIGYSSVNLYLQELDVSYQEIGNRFTVGVNSGVGSDFPDVIGLSRTGYAVAFLTTNLASPSSLADVYLQIYYGEEINLTCKDIVVFIKTNYLYSLADDFVKNISYQYMTDMRRHSLETPSLVVFSQ
jgi:hypothetical protein